MTISDGKLASIREYIDTQALARAAMPAVPEGDPRPDDRSDLRAS
jgi:hypothetical protein